MCDRLPPELAELVERLGVSPGTRFRFRRGVPLGVLSRSTRDGFRPQARAHVVRYVLVAVLKAKVDHVAASERLTRRAVFASVKIGARLARENAAAIGLRPPPRKRHQDDDGE